VSPRSTDPVTDAGSPAITTSVPAVTCPTVAVTCVAPDWSAALG